MRRVDPKGQLSTLGGHTVAGICKGSQEVEVFSLGNAVLKGELSGR